MPQKDLQKETHTVVRLDERDDLIVALVDHPPGAEVVCEGRRYILHQGVRAKHQFAACALEAGQLVRMYGVTVGQTSTAIAVGEPITTKNLVDAMDEPSLGTHLPDWQSPDVSEWGDRTFDGFVRDDERFGTANHWLVVPLVFCENRNAQAIRDAMSAVLGFGGECPSHDLTRSLLTARQSGRSLDEILTLDVPQTSAKRPAKRPFPNVDGLKFLLHGGGCGETLEDTRALCRLLAGYVSHPNVAGATVLSLGCQNAQIELFHEELDGLNPNFNRPLFVFEQQKLGTASTLIEQAIRHTFVGLATADRLRREPVPLSGLIVGTECGGSDGFSGISANPVVGYCADLVVALGGSAILSEFPELASVQQNLVQRCIRPELAERFVDLMRDYNDQAVAVGSGFHANPSVGNIADGLITGGIKSAGAGRKGGTSPVVDVLDFTEPVTQHGLSLLCTPGGDVESTTALVGSRANLLLFTTGLGTPTGNPITPTLKISSNTPIARKMSDAIDFDAGPVIRGEATIEQLGDSLLEMLLDTASGRYVPKAVRLQQDDFLPWKRNVSL